MKEAYIFDAIRTPIGRYGGSLSSIRTDNLAALPLKELTNRNPDVDWSAVDDVLLGCANQAGEDNRNVARMAALLAGLPTQVPGTTINRLCGSGMDAVGYSARSIKSGETSLMIAGGVESMSRAPFVSPKATSAFSRENTLYDTTIGWRFVNQLMQKNYGVDSMPETAENIAQQFNISREDQDAFAFRSQQKTKVAQDNKFFNAEIMPVIVSNKSNDIVVDSDEHPRGNTTFESLGKLKTPFRVNGTVTAGNASGVNDGACALLLGDESCANNFNLTPMARIVAMATAGVDPRIMGFGPVPATEKVLKISGLSLHQMDVIELNEAFAAQALAVTRHLKLDDDAEHINPNGGAISLGHPLGMSGARLITTAINQLHKTKGKYALCTMCIGVGQGIAIIVENTRL